MKRYEIDRVPHLCSSWGIYTVKTERAVALHHVVFNEKPAILGRTMN